MRAPDGDSGEPLAQDGFGAHLALLWATLRRSPQRRALLGLALGLVVVVAATTAGQIRLNIWTKAFYDALAGKDLAAFGRQLLLYVAIAGSLLSLNVAQTWLNQTMKLKLREGLTRDLIEQWLAPRRAYLLAGAGAIGVNPDQRIHEDAHHLSDLSTDLAIGLLQSALLLASFIGVLWGLSSGVVLSFRGATFSVPGYMVWCALFYSGSAALLGWRAGRSLVEINAERYARESNLRFALVHANEQSEGIAVNRGEPEEKGRLNGELDRLIVILRVLIGVLTRLTWITSGYGWFTLVAPIIVAFPAYYGGSLSFGGMLMAVGAFEQVQLSLRWFVDNVGFIADWRATLFRVAGFRAALLEMDRLGGDASRIELVVGDEDKLIIDGLALISPAGRSCLDQPHVEIGPGERVLIAGAPGAGKTSLFRAIAGLWPWGAGRITLPSADQVMFMPKRPYIPDGPLRDILAYPAPAAAFSTQDYAGSLTRMGLDYLVARLDVSGRWDRDLTGPEQQALVFARLLLQKPRWVIVDEAIEALSAPARKAVFDIFAHELAASALVNISGPKADDAFFVRSLRLSRNPQCESLAMPDVQVKQGDPEKASAT